MQSMISSDDHTALARLHERLGKLKACLKVGLKIRHTFTKEESESSYQEARRKLKLALQAMGLKSEKRIEDKLVSLKKVLETFEASGLEAHQAKIGEVRDEIEKVVALQTQAE